MERGRRPRTDPGPPSTGRPVSMTCTTVSGPRVCAAPGATSDVSRRRSVRTRRSSSSLVPYSGSFPITPSFSAPTMTQESGDLGLTARTPDRPEDRTDGTKTTVTLKALFHLPCGGRGVSSRLKTPDRSHTTPDTRGPPVGRDP